MDSKKILDQLKDQKIQNYSYNIFFFIIFAFFLVFAIRPNLMTAFNLQKELQDLKLKSQEFEVEIQKIVDYQTKVEQYRDQFYLLDEALPASPAVAKVFEDLRKSATDSAVILNSINVEEVKIKSEEKLEGLKGYNMTLNAQSDIFGLQNFLNALTDQRRIKTIENLEISKDSQDGATVEQFTITMLIKGLYL
ncbi:hypothetical protein A3A93_01220 [Candidatus Roizmanbacteria bacterium RIFCSPLOWO2_01_FULL_38_12]|uniref:Pilus assembly protein PilO n=1 Tax=Candidatus Roizmanbacteria bacterium RIFCSPLOWO2_01_FULL_38_12 TaxID=1802061 RepID=A0A1F7IR26_9BACT|nr:MAG: hypothetical protein A3F59_03035 [Candidatus Roizmanbacteria bacterium RIFCSPHIGHO2_12_FULL_38_13]OGK45819.1 MAG: hypothetical protein A3A93_01220 [Candidatus Roizmanbacteria bacterium RIFCSPLOWO2_01_FULL_38_12]